MTEQPSSSSSPIRRVAVLGAGTMGHGIAHVCALAGLQTHLYDLDAAAVERGLQKVHQTLDAGVAKGKTSAEQRDRVHAHLRGAASLDAAVEGADLVVEAIPERLDWKLDLLGQLRGRVGPDTVVATNTSSLSIARIAAGAPDPARVLGMHFFNPVHVMALLELVVHPGTDPAVQAAALAFGAAIGKECIVVRDSPGFATSRLGVCLGMEAIRMVEEGVASAEDIDKAMVLGYRHPIGPLRLTDLVGLDVRLHIGDYLADALGNPAFRPPALMRRMVAEGQLGQKSKRGFYAW
jgi:3-hydroxybutyryl-CoA dehydrogenase